MAAVAIWFPEANARRLAKRQAIVDSEQARPSALATSGMARPVSRVPPATRRIHRGWENPSTLSPSLKVRPCPSRRRRM